MRKLLWYLVLAVACGGSSTEPPPVPKFDTSKLTGRTDHGGQVSGKPVTPIKLFGTEPDSVSH